MKNREREPQRERQRGKKDSDGLQAREEKGRGNQTERDGENQRIVIGRRGEKEELKRGQ